MLAVLQRLKSVVCSAFDPSLRKELPNTIQSSLLRDTMKTVILKSSVDLSFQGGINSGLREIYRLQEPLGTEQMRKAFTILSQKFFGSIFLFTPNTTSVKYLSIIHLTLINRKI